MAAGSFKIYGLQKDGSRIPAAGGIIEGNNGSSGGNSGTSEIITLTQAEFDALSQTDIANYHANGVKNIMVAVEGDNIGDIGIVGASEIITLTQEEFDALSQSDISRYHANGVRTILVKGVSESGEPVFMRLDVAMQLSDEQKENVVESLGLDERYSGLKMELLWANVSQNSSFAEQDISVEGIGDRNAYPIILVLTKNGAIFLDNAVSNWKIAFFAEVQSSAVYFHSRSYQILSVGKLHVNVNRQVDKNMTISEANAQNQPWYIYGIKGVSA